MSKRIHNSFKPINYKQIISCNNPATGVHQNKKAVLTSNIGSCSQPIRELSTGGFSVCKDSILNKLRVTTALYATNIFHQGDFPILPPGLIMQYSGNPANPPGGWLMCDGSAVSKTQYACLYEVIGSTYAVETATEFYLPDLRGRVIVGTGTGPGLTQRDIGDVGGEEDHTLIIAEMPTHTHAITINAVPSHTHGVTDPGHNHSYVNQPNAINNISEVPPLGTAVADNVNVGQTTGNSFTNITINAAGGHTHTATIHPEGGSQPHNNMQPYLVVNYIIKF